MKQFLEKKNRIKDIITAINGKNSSYLNVPALADNNVISLLHTKARRYVGRNVGVPFLIPEGERRNTICQNNEEKNQMPVAVAVACGYGGVQESTSDTS